MPGGKKPPDFKVRPPGAQGQRSDMQGNQPVRVPTGLPYGSRSALEQAQSSVPVPQTTIGSQGPPGDVGAQAAPVGDVAALLGQHPTQRPDEPIHTPAFQAQDEVDTAALKVDIFSHLASLPFASPEIHKMLELAQTEYSIAHSESTMPEQPAWPTGPRTPPVEQQPIGEEVGQQGAPEAPAPEQGAIEQAPPMEAPLPVVQPQEPLAPPTG